MNESGAYRRTLATLGLFSIAAGDVWRNLLGWWGWGAVAVRHHRARDRRADPDARRPAAAALSAHRVPGALRRLSIAWSAYPGASAIGRRLRHPDDVVRALPRDGHRPHHVRALPGHRAALDPRPVARLRAVRRRRSIRDKVLPFWVDWSAPRQDPGGLLLVAQPAVRGRPHPGHRRQRQPARVRRPAGRRSSSRADRGALDLAALDRPAGSSSRSATLALTRSSTVLVAGAAVAIVAALPLAGAPRARRAPHPVVHRRRGHRRRRHRAGAGVPRPRCSGCSARAPTSPTASTSGTP